MSLPIEATFSFNSLFQRGLSQRTLRPPENIQRRVLCERPCGDGSVS